MMRIAGAALLIVAIALAMPACAVQRYARDDVARVLAQAGMQVRQVGAPAFDQRWDATRLDYVVDVNGRATRLSVWVYPLTPSVTMKRFREAFTPDGNPQRIFLARNLVGLVETDDEQVLRQVSCPFRPADQSRRCRPRRAG